MTRDEIRGTLVALLEDDTGNEYAGVDDAKRLREELGLDSVDIVSLVMQIERRFRVRLTADELQDVTTVGQVLDLLEQKLASGASGGSCMSVATACD